MKGQELLKLVEKDHIRKGRKVFLIGDTVDVHVKIVEGDKERIQIFNGTVIARNGSGSNESFTVRRLVGSQGVERIFPINSPRVEKIEVKRRGRVRRAKLYYLRDRVGKATRVTEKRGMELASSDDYDEEPRGEGVKPREAGLQAEASPEEDEPAKE